MAYIKLNNDMPGILGPLWTKPSTGKPLAKFTHALLKGPSSLSSGERELIASYVSSRNECNFCYNSHSAAAAAHLNGNEKLVNDVKTNPLTANISDKMKSLLLIAGKVQQSGKSVSASDFDAARKAGASDEDLHEAVLIAAAFCMFNRYVDGLGTQEPEFNEEYKEMGERLSKQGYKFPPFAWLRNYINNQRNKKLAAKRK